MSKEITEKNAISILNSARPRKGSYDRLQAAFEMAVKALEKQIPKKVANPIRKGAYSDCPICGIELEMPWCYCYKCGQKVYWGVDDEKH